MANPGGDNLALARVDMMLDSLDQLAQTESSPARFYAELLGQLKLVLAAKDCCIVASIQLTSWSSLAATNARFGSQAVQQLKHLATSNTPTMPLRWAEELQDSSWIGCGLHHSNWTAGGIVVQIPLTNPPIHGQTPLPADTKSMQELLAAFAEIVNRFQLKQGFMQVNKQAHEVRAVAASILACRKASDADRVLVDGTRCLIDADRVTLVDVGSRNRDYQTLAISGHPKIDPQSNFVRLLKNHLLATDTWRDANEQLVEWAREIGSAVAIAFPISQESGIPTSNEKSSASHLLVLEWFDEERFVHNASRIEPALPWLAVAWKSHPRSNSVRNLVPRLITCVLITICLAGCFVYFASSTELTIQSTGTLQPSAQRFVFAPSDGYIDAIQVADGQLVRSGDVIAIMESPQLQLQINQVAAEIGIVDQKRDGLNITLNQLKPADDPSNVTGSRLAGEVEELESRRQNLLEQKALLDREQQRLQLRSPISGTIIAWEVERHLESRPVRRGDLLFRIAALEGPWQIESTVVDWESGYVADAGQAQLSAGKPLAVEFVLSSATKDHGTGRIDRFGHAMRDVNGSQHLDLVIGPVSTIENPRLGASVTVSIPCGQFPRWFVWTRSILDAVRRRFLL